MSSEFFEKPILNSPYHDPGCHWKLDDTGQLTRLQDRIFRAVNGAIQVDKTRNACRIKDTSAPWQ